MKKALTLAAALALGATGSSLNAQEGGGQPDWLSQAKIVAEIEGVSVGEAVRRARLQVKADRQAEEFSSDPSYAGSWVVRSGQKYRLVYAFKGAGAANRKASDDEVTQNTDFVDVSFSLQEIRAWRKQLLAALSKAPLKVSIDTDVKRNRLVLNTTDASALQTLLQSSSIGQPAFVEIGTEFLYVVPQAVVFGAGDITGPLQPIASAGGRSGYPNCTAGFTVTNGSVQGINTAGHCTRDNLTTHRSAALGTKMDARVNASGLDGAWFRNSANTYNNSIPYNGAYYNITSTALLSSMAGQSVCLMKRDNTQQCAYVASNESYQYIPDLNGNFIQSGPLFRLDRNFSVAGDSGAPYFYGGRAYGTHIGKACTDQAQTNCPSMLASPVEALQQMGVSVFLGR